MSGGRRLSYENTLLILMCLANGIVGLDRVAINFLSPFLIAEFHLSNTQLGLLSSAFSTTASVSGVVLASLADRSGKRKQVFLAAFVLFSLLSAGTGLMTSFATLMAARFVMGLTAGPLSPVSQSFLSLESSPHRRGFNMGFVQNVGVYLIGLMLGPILCTWIGQAMGWRWAFFLSGVPGLLMGGLILLLVRNPPGGQDEHAARPGAWAQLRLLLSSRNLILCVLISAMFSSWLVVQNAFMPRYLTDVDGMTPAGAGLLISVIGIAGAVGGVAIPWLSDRFGRKPAIVAAAFGGVIAPAALMLIHPGGAPLAAGLFVGWLAGSAGPLYLAIIPTESVPPRFGASAVALSLGVGEIVGGILAPAAAGMAADAWGLDAPYLISAACALVSGVLALFLTETRPGGRQATPALA